jgi:hypothetical protein
MLYKDGQYRLYGVCPHTNHLILVVFCVADKEPWTVEGVTCHAFGDVQVAEYVLNLSKPDVVVLLPMNQMPMQLWSIHQLYRPVAYLDGLRNISRIMLECMRHEGQPFQHDPLCIVAMSPSILGVWVLAQVRLGSEPRHISPCKMYVVPSTVGHTELHQGLVFNMESDGRTHIWDVFGGGKVNYSAKHRRWSLQTNEGEKPHVVATLPPQFNWDGTHSTPNHVSIHCTTNVSRLCLDAPIDFDLPPAILKKVKKRQQCTVS